MPPKMRSIINDTAKAKARAVVEGKKKVVEEEKKMYALQQRLNRIRKSNRDEQNWTKHWVESREWGKRKNPLNFTTTRIKSYLNAPIIENFGSLK